MVMAMGVGDVDDSDDDDVVRQRRPRRNCRCLCHRSRRPQFVVWVGLVCLRPSSGFADCLAVFVAITTVYDVLDV